MDRVSNKLKSITNSHDLLLEIIAAPKTCGGVDISNLKSQKRFAQLDIPEKNIVPMSLNRWKAYADEVLPIGWKGLDKLRKKALNAIELEDKKGNKPSRGSKKDLEIKLDEKKNISQSYLNEIIRLSEQYKHLLEICHMQARQDADFKDLFHIHLKRYAYIDKLYAVKNLEAVYDDK